MSTGSGENRWSQPAAAVAVSEAAALSDEARVLLKTDHSPQQYCAELVNAGLGVEAVKIIPFALPRREAIWWAAQCLKTAAGPMAEPKSAAAITAVEKWCTQPSEDLRRAALTASEAADMGTPAGCLAMAVFLSEGSLAPPNVAAVPPPPNVGPGMAANAVVLAAVIHEPEKAADKSAQFVHLADAVAAGTNRWNDGKPPASPTAAPSSASSGAKAFPPYPQAKR